MINVSRQSLRAFKSRELLSGFTAFLTSAYLLFLIPSMFAEVGAPIAEATTSVALIAALASVAMGLFANKPLLVAPGISTTVYLVYVVVLGGSLSLLEAIAAAFCAGMLFLLLALFGLHRFLYHAIPATIRLAFVVGIGLFLIMIGLRSAGLIDYQAASLPRLGNLSEPLTLLALMGIALIGILLWLRVPLALLLGLLVTTSLAWTLGLTSSPAQIVSTPVVPQTLFFSLDFTEVFSRPFLVAVSGLFFLLVLDVTGALTGLANLEKTSKGLASKSSYSTVAGASVLGALLGMSPSVVLLESAVGMQAGGRGGTTAVVAGICFAFALFFTPIFAAVPAAATAPLIIIVGLMMMRSVSSIDWRIWHRAVPAFITIGTMALTLNIPQGLAVGMLSYVLCTVLAGRREGLNSKHYLLSMLLAWYLLLYN